jgi:hypothetical protein
LLKSSFPPIGGETLTTRRTLEVVPPRLRFAPLRLGWQIIDSHPVDARRTLVALYLRQMA